MHPALRHTYYYGNTSSVLNLSVPTVAGTTRMAQTLTVTEGTWAGTPTLTYQWYKSDDTSGTNEVAIDGATYTQYQPCMLDVGKFLRIRETANSTTHAFSSYTSIVDTIIVMEDTFNKTETINAGRWTVTNPADNLLVDQRIGGLVFADNTGNATIALRLNQVVSVDTITTGTIAAKLKLIGNNSVTFLFSLQFGGGGNLNEIQIVKGSGTSNVTISVRVAGVAVYTLVTAISINNRWKIAYDAAAQTVKFWYRNAGVWTQAGTTQTGINYGGATAQAVFSMSAVNSGTSACGAREFFMTDEDYTSVLPDMFVPPTAPTPQTQWFESLKLGWFFHSPQYEEYDIDNPRRRMNFNFDFDTLADQAESAGNIHHVSLHAKNGQGFRYFPSASIDKYWNGSTHAYNSLTVPQYGFDYGIDHADLDALGITDDHLQRYLDAFGAKGIATGIYYALGRDENYRTALTTGEAAGSATAAIYEKFDEYMDFVFRELDYILQNHTGIKFIWFDEAAFYWPEKNSFNDNDMDEKWNKLYNRIKRSNSSVMCLMNYPASLNGGSFYDTGSLEKRPMDVITVEYDNKPSDAELEDLTRNYNGTVYQIPGEVAHSLYGGDFVDPQWTWLDPAFYGGQNVNVIDSQADFQAFYDFCKARGIPAFLNMPIKQDGTLDATYLSRASGIVL